MAYTRPSSMHTVDPRLRLVYAIVEQTIDDAYQYVRGGPYKDDEEQDACVDAFHCIIYMDDDWAMWCHAIGLEATWVRQKLYSALKRC